MQLAVNAMFRAKADIHDRFTIRSSCIVESIPIVRLNWEIRGKHIGVERSALARNATKEIGALLVRLGATKRGVCGGALRANT